MKNLKINHTAVWTCIVLALGFGYLWYGVFFQEVWITHVKLSPDAAGQAAVGSWITNTITITVQMYVLAWILVKLDVDSGAQGALIGILIGFSFNFMQVMTTGMFAMEPYGLAWVEGGFTMANLGISGFILGSWTKTGD